MALISIEELESASPLFRGRAGNAFARKLLHLLNVDRIDEHMQALSVFRGPEFAQKVNEAAGMSYTVNGMPRAEALEHFRSLLPEGPFITISNHPMGGMDGVMMVDLMGHLYPDYKLIVYLQ